MHSWKGLGSYLFLSLSRGDSSEHYELNMSMEIVHQVFELQTDIFAQREQSVVWRYVDVLWHLPTPTIKSNSSSACLLPSLQCLWLTLCQTTSPAMPLPSQIPTCPHPALFTLEATSCVTNLIQIMVHPVNSRFRPGSVCSDALRWGQLTRLTLEWLLLQVSASDWGTKLTSGLLSALPVPGHPTSLPPSKSPPYRYSKISLHQLISYHNIH